MGGGGGESSEGGGMPGGSGRSFHFRPGGGGGFRSPDDIFREFFSNQFNSDSDGDFGGGFPGYV